MLLVAKPHPDHNTFDLGATAKCLHRPGCVRMPCYLPRRVIIPFEESRTALPGKDVKVQYIEALVIRATQPVLCTPPPTGLK